MSIMSYFVILHVLRLSFLGTEDNLLMEESAQILEVETFIPMLLQNAENGVSRHVGDTAMGEADLNCSTSNMFKTDTSYSCFDVGDVPAATKFLMWILSSNSLALFFRISFSISSLYSSSGSPQLRLQIHFISPVQSISVLPQSSIPFCSARFSLPIAFMPVSTSCRFLFLSRLKRVMLIGDHHQLPPVVKNRAFQHLAVLTSEVKCNTIGPPWHLDKAPDNVNPYPKSFVVKSQFWKSGKFEFTKRIAFCSKIKYEQAFFHVQMFSNGCMDGFHSFWMTFRKYGHLDQSLYARFVRLKTPTVDLNLQGRARRPHFRCIVLQCVESSCIFVFLQVSKCLQVSTKRCFRRFAAWRPSIAELYSWRYRDLGNLPNVLTDERRIWFSSF